MYIWYDQELKLLCSNIKKIEGYVFIFDENKYVKLSVMEYCYVL